MGILTRLRTDFPERPITQADRARIAEQCREYRRDRRLARIAARAADLPAAVVGQIIDTETAARLQRGISPQVTP
jgi:hypothetical protein